MSNLQSDLDTVKDGLAKIFHFALNEPKQKGGGAKDYEDYQKRMKDHAEASSKWSQEEGPKVVEAAFNILAQFFKDINSIADGVNK